MEGRPLYACYPAEIAEHLRHLKTKYNAEMADSLVVDDDVFAQAAFHPTDIDDVVGAWPSPLPPYATTFLCRPLPSPLPLCSSCSGQYVRLRELEQACQGHDQKRNLALQQVAASLPTTVVKAPCVACLHANPTAIPSSASQ